jgi:hypothetical protein
MPGRDTGRTGRAYTIGVQFAVAAAALIEESLNETFTALHDFTIEPEAGEDGYPYVLITAKKPAIDALSQRFAGSVNIMLTPGCGRDVEIILKPSVPAHKLS